jgi:hypothetical protein
MTSPRFRGARPRLGQSLETVARSGAELEVRIHSPPAESPSLSDFALVPGKSPDFPPVWARGQAVRSAETREVHQRRAEER